MDMLVQNLPDLVQKKSLGAAKGQFSWSWRRPQQQPPLQGQSRPKMQKQKLRKPSLLTRTPGMGSFSSPIYYFCSLLIVICLLLFIKAIQINNQCLYVILELILIIIHFPTSQPNLFLQSYTTMRDTQLEKYEQWLSYSPLLYNYLSLHQIPHFSDIRDVKWVRAINRPQSVFKMQEKFVCLVGKKSMDKGEKQTNAEKGIVAIYDLKYPDLHELDDVRVQPIIQPQKILEYQSPVTIAQQFTIQWEDSYLNNCFAISSEHIFQIHLLNTKQLLLQNQSEPLVIQRCPKLKGHTGRITKICWGNILGKGPSLVSSSLDNSLILWDLQKVKAKEELKYHRSGVRDVCFIYNCRGQNWFDYHEIDEPYLIASAGQDGYLLLWDERQKIPCNRINCKQKQLYSVASVSSEVILTGGSDGTVKLWDLKHHKEYCYSTYKEKCQTHYSRITKINVHRRKQDKEKQSGEGKRKQYTNVQGKISFSTGANDGKIIIWQERAHFIHEGHQSEISSFDRLEEEGMFISCERNMNSIMVWENGITLGPIQI